jgi:hypothetical protein
MNLELHQSNARSASQGQGYGGLTQKKSIVRR